MLKLQPGSDLCEVFSTSSLFSKVILLICSNNVAMLYIIVPEIWSINV